VPREGPPPSASPSRGLPTSSSPSPCWREAEGEEALKRREMRPLQHVRSVARSKKHRLSVSRQGSTWKQEGESWRLPAPHLFRPPTSRQRMLNPQDKLKSHTQPLSRSPGRTRGRPRKLATPPPLRPLQQLRASSYFLPGAFAVAAVVLGLLLCALFLLLLPPAKLIFSSYSAAIRISARQSDPSYGTIIDSKTGASPPYAGSRPGGSLHRNGRVEVLTNDQENRVTPSYVGFSEGSGERLKDDTHQRNPLKQEDLDAAVQHALEEAWHLPPHHQDSTGAGENPAKVREDKPRTLEELYAELDGPSALSSPLFPHLHPYSPPIFSIVPVTELGISPHELQEALDEGLKEAGEKRA
jgi:hypothetical protein